MIKKPRRRRIDPALREARARIQAKACPVFYQWSNGHRLALLPVTEDLWKLVRKLWWGCRPSLDAGLEGWSLLTNGEALYAAAHWPDFPHSDLPRGKVGYGYVHDVEFPRVQMADGWWLGAHVAQPRKHLLVMTPPLGTLAMLSPPALSKKWALRVKSFDSMAAKAWALNAGRQPP